MHSVTYRELLGRNRNFRWLWMGQIISELGTWFSFIAELGLVRLISGSTWATTALLVARLLPFLLVAPIAGVFVDRHSRKRILILTDLLRALVALLYVAAGALRSVELVIIGSALMSSLTMFFEGAKNAAIPNLTSGRELLSANVLMFSLRFLQFTLGSALGGVTAAQFGYNVAFIVNSLSFVASAICIAAIPASAMRKASIQAGAQAVVATSVEAAATEPIAGSEQPIAAERQHFLTDLREGLRYIWATPFVRAVILVNIGWGTGGGMTNIIFDQVGGHVFNGGAGNRGDWNVAMLFTAAGAGVFLGMLLSRRVSAWINDEQRAGRFIGWTLLLHGGLFAIGGWMPSLLLMSIWIAASRLVLGAEFGVQETMMMRVIPDDYRGRVFTTDRSLELATMAITTIVAGWLLTYFSPRVMMITSGLLSASPGLFWLMAMWAARFSVPTRAVRESYGD
jgi:MFS family permease